MLIIIIYLTGWQAALTGSGHLNGYWLCPAKGVALWLERVSLV